LDQNSKKLFLRAIKRVGENPAETPYIDVTNHIKSNFIIGGNAIVLSGNDLEPVIGYPVKSFHCVSMYSEKEALGAICVFNRMPEKSDIDIELLYTLVEFASLAIEKTKLMGDADLKVETLSTLYKISHSMLSETKLKKLLETITFEALNVLDADIVVLYEYDKKKRDFKIPPIYEGINIKAHQTLKRRGKTHRESILFKLIKQEKPFYAANAVVDWSDFEFPGRENYLRKSSFIDREEIVSSAGIPLRIDKEPVGILFINYRKFQPFTDDHKTRIETFANYAALAIKNARIFAQRDRYTKQLSVLNKIVRKISSDVTLNIDDILNLIYKQTRRLMDVTNFYVAFYEEENNLVRFEFAVEKGVRQKTGEGDWKDRIHGNGLTEYVIQTKKSLLIPARAEDWISKKKLGKFGKEASSWLGAPMILENKVLGAIGIQNHERDNAYDSRDEKVLNTIASQAAMAIGNARLFQESREKNEELNGLYKISQEILSESMKIKPVLNKILRTAVQFSNSDSGQILFHDEETGESRVAFTYQSDILKGITVNPGEGMAGEVISKGMPVFTNDYYSSEFMSKKLDEPKYREIIKGMVQVPLKLKWQDRLLGVLSLISKPGSKRIFKENDIQLLQHFAGPASIALALARNISFQQSLLDNSPDAIIAVDRNGLVTNFNKSSEQIMGYKKEELIGRDVADLYYGGLKEAKRINHILIENESRREPIRNIITSVRGCHEDEIPILLTGSILRDELGESIGSIGLMKDFSEIDELDEEYRAQQYFLTSIEQYSQDTPNNTQLDLKHRLTKILEKTGNFCKFEYIILFASTSEDDTVLKAIAWSGRLSDLEGDMPHFNWRKAKPQPSTNNKDEVLRKETELINSWLPDEEWRKRVVSGIRGNNTDFFEDISCGVPVRLADNYRAVLVFGPYNGERHLLEMTDFIRNIANKINIHALSWLQALYLRSKNIESERSKELLVHRTRMQLQQIIGKFGAIKKNTDDDSLLRKKAVEGEELISHLAKVINRSLTSPTAEMETGDYDFQAYPLSALIQNCIEDFKEKALENKLNIEIDDRIENLPYAEVDPLMLSVAIGNLVENAIKYSFKETSIKISSQCDARKVLIIVQNLGERMSENARKNLAKPGERHGISARARSIPGTGFGLWDASLIAVAHGGKLDFSSVYTKSVKGKKTSMVKVWLELPLKREK
jgi:PAS domain S-box-containing protein